MKTRLLLLLLLLVGVTAQAEPADDVRYVARVMKKVDEGMEKARAHLDRPDWFVQCQIDLRELEEALPRLPESARAPYLAKIKVYRPEVEAGVKLSRGMHVARQIRGLLDSAKEDLPKGPIDQTIFEKLDGVFADPDAQGIPADQMKALQTEYAELKKVGSKKKQ